METTQTKTLDYKTHLLEDLHKTYIKNLEKNKDTFQYWATEQLRISGVYWGLSGMAILDAVEEMDKEAIVEYVLSCQNEDGGFGGNVGHDSHLLYTLSAIQILCILESLEKLNSDLTVQYICKLQQSDGSFSGDQWGEIDTRFSYCAICGLALLKRLDSINIPNAVQFILKCQNFDGGFGCVPGAETHGGQIFCCVGALAILGELDSCDKDLLGWWLSERQVSSGGLNGRPEKLPDVCYSWWILSSLSLLQRLPWIHSQKLISWILSCQDDENGGIADRPGDLSDVFHTFFGLSGLALLGFKNEGKELKQIDPAFALPVHTLQKMNLSWKH